MPSGEKQRWSLIIGIGKSLLRAKKACKAEEEPWEEWLETAVGVAAEAMITSGLAVWPRLVRWFTTGPAGVLRSTPNGEGPEPRHAAIGMDGTSLGTIEIGQRADITLLDPEHRWTVDPSRFESKGRCTPFASRELTARAVATIRGPHVCVAADNLSATS